MRFALVPAAVAAFACCVWADAADNIASSVVKIHVVSRPPDFARPWAKGSPQESSGSGVILEGHRILTNAHVMQYSSQIFVQADQSAERVPAKVKAIAMGIDLAIIEVIRPSFFKDHPPLSLAAGLPSLKQSVSVYGYPMGGEQISVTQGIISRVEHTTVYCGARALRIQIDAAINPGNSGGPGIVDGKIVGLVFSKVAKGENIGYLIAADEIRMFLDAVKDGVYQGKPQLWDWLHSTENEALRAKLGLRKEAGLVVINPLSTLPDYPLKRWDVILKIGDEPVDSQSNINAKDGLRLSYEYLVPKLAKNGHVKLTIFRDRKTIEVQVPAPPDGNLVIPYILDKYPRYFVYGPMIFMPAYQDVVWRLPAATLMANKSPLLTRVTSQPRFEGEEIVTLGAALLPHKTSKGYRPPPFSVVSRVNGTEVRNMKHLVELLRDAKGEFLTIDLAGFSPSLVFRTAEMADATEEILADEGIRKQYSNEFEKIWHPKK
jgi:S1-C subfamily serine protease